MNSFVARENIKRFERMLSVEGDARKRETLSNLLKQEKAKLAELDGERARPKPSGATE